MLGPDAPPVSTIFVGGGTPTLLPADDLGRLVAEIRSRFGLTADAEVTTESNPESIDAAGLVRLRELGFTRISFGMQSAVPYVLTVLDRVHTPGRPEQAVRRSPGGRVHRHQPGPDLRHPRGVAQRLGDQPRRGAGGASPTTSARTP